MRRLTAFKATVVSVLLGALAAGCAAAAAPEPAKPGGQAKPSATLSADAQAGRELFSSKGCIACHRAPGVREAVGTVGPDLRGMAKRKIAGTIENNQANMRRWLLNPSAMKPGTQMPSFGLTDNEAARLTAYMETLQ